jgi:hypothetical protein
MLMKRAFATRREWFQKICWLAALISFRAIAQTNLFFDDFNGPAMNSGWVTSGLPTTFNPSSYPFDVSYEGAPDVSFQPIGGASTVRMNTELPALRRVGWTLGTVFTNASFRYEVRFNTLIQSPTTSIDGCIELWVLDATDSNRCDVVALFGSWSSTSPRFMTGSSIDHSYFVPDFSYQNNTWYRLVLRGNTNENIRASLCDDQGTELISQFFAHNTRAFPAGFKIGLSQGMGTPNSVFPMDIAVDYAVLSTLSGPEPSLTVSPVPGGLVVQWPVSLRFVLDSAPSLAPPIQWQPVTNHVAVLNGFNSVFISHDEPSAYFRLRYQSP